MARGAPRAPDAPAGGPRSRADRWWRVALRVAGHVGRHALRDNAFLLASGIAFDVLLAFLPFVLLVTSAVGWLLPLAPAAAAQDLVGLVGDVLPSSSAAFREIVARALQDLIRTREALGAAALVSFFWFSSRLFGSLRLVMARVFEEPEPRGLWAGLLFDFRLTVSATVFALLYVALHAVAVWAGAAGSDALDGVGIPVPAVFAAVRGPLVHIAGLLLVTLIFHALYSIIPRRKLPPRSVLAASLTAGAAIEVARLAFEFLVPRLPVMSVYTGTIAAVVVVLFWTYYVSLIFVLGGDVLEGVEWERSGHPVTRAHPAVPTAAAGPPVFTLPR
jgi:membrane protein